MKFIHDFGRNLKDGVKNLYKGALLFHDRRGTTLASSSSFYALITIIPFLLLMVRAIGLFLGNVSKTQKYLFVLGSHFFPKVAPELLITVQELIKGLLFSGTKFTLLNFCVLAISSMTFINSIWTGLYFITEDRTYLSFWRIFKGFVIIALTLLMMALVFILPPAIIYVIKFIQTNIVTQFFYENFDTFHPVIKFIKEINLRKSYWLNSSGLHIGILLAYFTVLYRWLFSARINWKEAFVASLAFSISIFFGKYLFGIYLFYVRSNLMKNYGDLYTTVAGVIWLLYLMCFFFYGACVCHAYRLRRDNHKKSYERKIYDSFNY